MACARTTAERGVRFVPADPIEQDAVPGVQLVVRTKLLAYATARGFLEPDEARQMRAWKHGGGCSLDASEHIAAHERDAYVGVQTESPANLFNPEWNRYFNKRCTSDTLY